MRLPVIATLIGAIALHAPIRAQSPAAAQPTFRTGTTLVEVSAIATRDGQPVTDLRPDEVMVLDNGVPQTLVAFEFVDLAVVDGPAQRRDFVILVDNMHVDADRTSPMIDTAVALVDRLGSHDRLAIATTGLPDDPLDFTTDRETARAFLRQLRGEQPRGPMLPLEMSARARDAMRRLSALTAELRSDAERRAILFISEGHPTLGQTSEIRRNELNGFAEFLDVIRQAALANVAIYTVDPRGLRAPGSSSVASRSMSMFGTSENMSVLTLPNSGFVDDATGSLAVLALNTGGIQTRWTNDLTANVTRMIDDSRRYYRFAYVQPDPPPGKSQPLTRAIKVKVSRRGVDVRARERYAPVKATS